MSYDILYHEAAVTEDIPKLSEAVRIRIRTAIENKLTVHPDLFGKPLRRSLKNYRKLRVGDYRIIFRLEKSTVKIFMIAHYSIIYRAIEKRA